MSTSNKAIIINAIIYRLNELIAIDNKRLCEQNLHYKQKPLHGGDMFFTLAFLDDHELSKIASAAGI